MKNKIGIAVITCNRLSFFEKCITSITKPDKMIIINDGDKISDSYFPTYADEVVQHKKNLGVGKSKNEGIKFLLENGCEHIFLCEDDILIKNNEVFNQYIRTAKKTGIYHLNFAYHGDGNKDINGKSVARKIVMDEVGNELLSLNQNLVGAFSYYYYKLFEKVGLIDEQFFNAWEHVDHTYQIIKAGYHPPFWWFADIANSDTYIGDQDVDHSQSVIRKKGLLWKLNLYRNTKRFKNKNGIEPYNIPDTSEQIVDQELAMLKNRVSSI